MDRDYDLFEKFPDGSTRWRAFVPGLENAVVKLEALAKLSPNEHLAIHRTTHEIVRRVNATPAATD
jgi:hypothetical protein